VLGRRAFLVEGSKVAAALAIGPSWWRRCGNADGETRAAATVLPVPPGSGAVCVGSAVPRSIKPPLHPDALARWVDALPIPSVLRPTGSVPAPDDPTRQVASYRIAMRAVETRVHRDVPPTRVWGYEGVVPGPTIEVRRGQGITIEWANELPEKHFLPVDHSLHGAHADQPEVRTVVHVHGAKVPPESDGYPEAWYPPDHAAVHHYPNQQDATLLWYHDHAMGLERLNQYAGLFGLYVIRDEVEEALDLPAGAHEVPLVLCDRLFDADGQLRYPTSGMDDSPWVSEVNGDALLVNGKLYPYFEVEPRRYRLRVLNAANSRFYDLSFSDGRPFQQIGADQGLLPAPVVLTTLTLAPAERADLVVDFSDAAGRNVVLANRAFELLQFRVAATPAVPSPAVPPRLRPMTRLAASSARKTRVLSLDEYEDQTTHRALMLLNATYWRDPVTETPELDSVEIWSFVNRTEDTHPIHLHLVRFQILDRQKFDIDQYTFKGTMRLIGPPVPPGPGEAGWKDVVRAEPGMITRIIARFEGYAGRYVWHCHVLEHAANEMMRPFEVVVAKG
jgi:spore coat protein A